MKKNNIEPQNIEKILSRARKDKKFRIALAYENHFWFFMFYFPHYLKYKPANFHKELFKLSEMKNNDLLVCTAFRGSGKSTIMSLSLPIWSIVGKKQKKFVLITSQTQPQVRQLYDNIKEEFESNELLINDFGPFIAKPWNDRTLKVQNYDAQILPVSLGSEIRGIRRKAHRPDLVIIDDVDSLSSVRNEDRRKKTIDWFDRDVRQIGEIGSDFVIIGNLLHEQCLVSILKQKILDGDIPGVYKQYSLLDDKGRCLWPAKFPTKADVERLRKSVISEATWLREYMLRIFNDETAVLTDADFSFYDMLPQHGDGSSHNITFISVDPALGEKESSDPTAIVQGDVYTKNNQSLMYMAPHYVNKRLRPTEYVQLIFELYNAVKMSGRRVVVLVETVAFQRLLVDLLVNAGVSECDIKEVSPGSKEKRTRLELVSPYITRSVVLFPRGYYDEPIMQLKNVGIGGIHDDLADAIVYAIMGFSEYVAKGVSIPIAVKVLNPRSSFSIFYGREDWAEREDRELFPNLHRHEIC